MTWACFYSTADAQAIQDEVTAASNSSKITGSNRNRLRQYWNAGLSSWQTAPFTTDAQAQQYNLNIDPGETRTIVCTFGTVADFASLLQTVAVADPAWAFMGAIASDLTHGGAVENWTG